MNKLSKLSIINSIILLVIISYLVINQLKTNKEELAYVNNMSLFNGFNMTKDMKTIGGAEIKKRTQELDSLYSIFNSFSDKDKQEISNKGLQQQIAIKSKELQKFKEKQAYELNQQVWLRLNSHIKEYAKSNNVKVILGANGNGNIMYARDYLDITDKILQYSNEKYEGK